MAPFLPLSQDGPSGVEEGIARIREMSDEVHQARRALHRRVRELRGDIAELEAELADLGPGDTLPGLHLVLEAGGKKALVSASQVEEIAPAPDLSPIRGGPPEAAGLAAAAGRSLVALDLAAFLGARRTPPRDATLVVFHSQVAVGLLADAVSPASGPAVLVPANGAPPANWRHSRVLAQVGGEVLPLLHVERLAHVLDVHPERNGRTDGQLARQLARLEVSLERRGLKLCDRLRSRLRGHLASAAAELGLEASQVLPAILGGAPASICSLLEGAALGETYFFRHPQQFRALQRLLFASSDPGRALRLWSAGCGSGEEAYGLAALLEASGRPKGQDQVLGTDVSERALEHARQGIYGRWSFRGADPVLERLLPGAPNGTEVPAALRATVTYRAHDVRDPPPEGSYDAVLCRNVLPFLDPGEVPATLERLLDATRPGGYLLLAPGELSLAAALELERVESDGTVLLRRPWSRPDVRAVAGRNGVRR
ncbi:MAG TPA: CheR family methyltransferase [Anaeromyxobacteraceae bacterium]|nr:CheR family methyltransferase [Anaeromyxobacteraceae bacterium]